MTDTLLDSIPTDRRDAVDTALRTAFGASTTASRLDRISGGASGALIYRTEVGGATYLLRVEGPRTPLRNPHQYVCMQTAADAGIAPAIRYLDADAGVVLMDYVATRPPSEHPGGNVGLVREFGALLARLQHTAPFPELRDYPVLLERLLGMLRAKVFAPGLLDAHADGFARIREVYPWDASSQVSSHNDPNPRNILFDGERLWLVDWETAYRNDPWVDVAIVAENLAPTPQLEEALVQAWLGVEPDAVVRARLRLMRVLTRLYYAGLLLMIAAGGHVGAPLSDLSAPSEAEFRRAIASGSIAPTGPEAMITLGKMQLASFLTGVVDPAVIAALRTVREA
jgi:aminoglycoside phosphotransferase (APT) family kinase protein